jgi:predicted SprT family Zn-dependent metalloprotease
MIISIYARSVLAVDMELSQAEQLAIDLIRKHCPIYSFKWSKATRCFGTCNRTDKVITLSKPLTELNDIHNVQDTILHEIAHALTPTDKGHGWRWQEMCRRLGAKPVRCYSGENVILPPTNRRGFIYECPGCKKEITRYKTIINRKVSCRDCCIKFNGGCYTDKYNLVLKNNKEVTDE